MPESVQEYKDESMFKTSWWTRGIVLLVIFLNVVFVREVLDIFRTYQTEPAFLIGLVTALSAGEFSIVYFVHRSKKDIIRESIRYEHDYEIMPMMNQANDQAYDHLSMAPHRHESEGPVTDDYVDFEKVFPKGDYK